ncbi:MAG: hypothetical protein OEM52_14385, partial [bacterium]|nr:hypothetical protein [bacterium]
NYTQFRVCTNGWMSLGTAETSTTYSNTAIPNAGTPNNSLMPLWDDMYVDATLGHFIKYQTLGLDTLVVQWNVEHLSGTVTQQYQIILTSSGTITYQYNTMDTTQLTYTIGIENSTGTDGLQVRFNPTTAYATSGRAVRFSLPCNMVTLTSPANNAIQLPLTTVLSWTGSTCSDNYDVYFGTNQALVNGLDPTTLVASAITATTWDPPGDLVEGTSYYWRVVSRDTAVTPPDLFASTLFTFRTFSPGISGTRTIGGTNPDYATIQAAIDAVNASGCGTGVTFLIRGGVYEENPDSLVASALSGPNSPIIFKPADTLGVTINVTCTAAARQAYAFVNADNVVWDGSHPDLPGRNLIAVNAMGTDGYYGFRFANGSDGCKVKNIDITVGGTTSNYRPIYIYYSTALQPAAACMNDTVQNCKVTGGYYGMYIYGSSTMTHSGLVIEGNDVVDFNYYGMYIYYTVNSKFAGNQLHRTSASTSALYGLYNPTTSNVGNVFDRNWIYDLTPSATGTTYGMYMVATGTLITNNMINLDPTTGGTIYGLYLSTGLQHAYNNTVRIGGTTTGSYSSYALYISGTNSDSIVNNIFINDRSSTNMSYYHVGGYLPNATTFAYSNNNIWSNDSEDPTDNKYAVRVGTVNHNTLGDLLASGTYISIRTRWGFIRTLLAFPISI